MYWLRRLFRKPQTERQLDAEVRFHLRKQIVGDVQPFLIVLLVSVGFVLRVAL